MKRTNIVLDETLVQECKKLTGIRTARKLVDVALRDLARRRKQRGLLKLYGKIHWDGDLDEMRRDRTFE